MSCIGIILYLFKNDFFDLKVLGNVLCLPSLKEALDFVFRNGAEQIKSPKRLINSALCYSF